VEALRYYLMRDCAVGQDMDFTDDRLVQRYNADLANALGNLLNRALSMAQKYRGGKLARRIVADADVAGADEGARVVLERLHSLAATVREATAAFAQDMDQCMVHQALGRIESAVFYANGTVEICAPWKLAKAPEQAPQLDAVLYYLAECLRIVAIAILPVLPAAAAGIFAQLNWGQAATLASTEWGGLPDGHELGKPTPLFPRIEAEAK
jgi:methionyl-tRNA synthetase